MHGWLRLDLSTCQPPGLSRKFLSELGFEESFHSTPSFAYGPYSVWQLTERGLETAEDCLGVGLESINHLPLCTQTLLE